jgi:hypothetical protein
VDEECGGGVDRLIAVKRAGKPARAVKPKAKVQHIVRTYHGIESFCGKQVPGEQDYNLPVCKACQRSVATPISHRKVMARLGYRIRTRNRDSRPLCNCRATMELYGKAWPHRAGAVKGCHMGADGQAKDGMASPGCQCRACESTNTNGREDSPFWNAGMAQDTGHPIAKVPWPAWMGRDLETALAKWQALGAGVP